MGIEVFFAQGERRPKRLESSTIRVFFKAETCSAKANSLFWFVG